MGAITREELAKQLVAEADNYAGTLAVEVLELECKKFLATKPRLLRKPK